MTFLLAFASLAAEPAVKDSLAIEPSVADSTERTAKKSVPLPRQSAYTGYGLLVGLAAGIFNPTKECDCLGVWQGQFEYHYRDYVTGGFDVRFFGGTLDRDMMLMYQRYRNEANEHQSDEERQELEKLSRYKLIDAKVVSNEVHRANNLLTIDKGSKDSVEVGMGVALSRYLGLMGSASYEFNFSWAQLVSFSPGIAFNVQEIWPWGRNNLRSTWVSFEMIFQRYFNRGVGEWAVAGFVGLQFGI